MPTNAIGREVEEIISLLASGGQSLSTAESLTGGGLGAMITSVPGASKIYLGGVIAYNANVKENLLGVRRSDIEEFGVVSQEVAMAMAQGARKKFSSTWAIATTGVAGPGASAGIAPGTVWIAMCGPVVSSTFLELDGERQSLQNATIASAISAFARILRASSRA